MKGHIRERSSGRFAIVIDTRDPSGKRRRKWVSFSGTKREARIECARLITEMKSGAYVDATRETVAGFLHRWIEHMQGQVSPRSLERYAELCRNNNCAATGGHTADKTAAGSNLPSLRQGARQRPPGRYWRIIPAYCAPHASGVARGAS